MKPKISRYLALMMICILILPAPTAAEGNVLTLPPSLKTVQAQAFMGDRSLEEVILPEGLETIGEMAFADTSITLITLPRSLTAIADSAFSGSQSLTAKVYWNSYAETFCREHGVPYTLIDGAPVTGIALYREEAPVSALYLSLEGETQAILHAALTPDVPDDPRVTWRSTSERIFTIDKAQTAENGEAVTVSAAASGEALLTAETANGLWAQCAVYVMGVRIFSPLSAFAVGSQALLRAEVTPASAPDRAVVWTSSDPSVAAVDETGFLTVLGAGTARITAVTVRGGAAASFTVSVPSAPAPDPTPAPSPSPTPDALPADLLAILKGACVRTRTAADGECPVFTSSALAVQGTESLGPWNARTFPEDEIILFAIGVNSQGTAYARVQFPAGGDKPNTFGYMRLADLTPCAEGREAFTAVSSLNALAARPGGPAYGEVNAGDRVYTLGRQAGYYQVMFPVPGAWRLAWATAAQYVTLFGGTPPAVAAQADKTGAYAGETVTLTAEVTGGEGTLSYQWQQSPDGSTWIDVPGGDAAAFSFAAAEETLGCQYRCRVTDDWGDWHSNPVKIALLRPVYRAVVVGNDAYPGDSVLSTDGGAVIVDHYGRSFWFGTLRCCVNDANAVAGMLRGLSNGFDTLTLTNATSVQMLSTLPAHLGAAGDHDVSLFYYSGHGFGLSTEPETDALRNLQGGLVGVDAEVVKFSELRDALNGVNGRVIIILDSCYSGAAISDRSAGGLSPEEIARAMDCAAVEAFAGYTVKAYDQNGRSSEFAAAKYIVLTACRYLETSVGSTSSVFTRSFLKGLGCAYPNGPYGGAMPADVNGDMLITLGEAYDYAYAEALRLYAYQHAMKYGENAAVLFRRK